MNVASAYTPTGTSADTPLNQTLAEQSTKFLSEIQSRRRHPVKSGTLKAYQSHLTKWILPMLGQHALAEIENGRAKQFIQHLSDNDLTPASVNAIFSVLKQVIKSAVDQNGNILFPRTWNADFLDLPVINRSHQDAPIILPERVSEAIRQTIPMNKALYALLAGTGLRIGEALCLMTPGVAGYHSVWYPDRAMIDVKTTLVNGLVQTSPKTEAGIREVDLAPELNEFLLKQLSPKPGLLFSNSNGDLVDIHTAYRHLRDSGVNTGFHSFRRFRLTHLDKENVPEGLKRFWAGHAGQDVSERYVKIGSDIQARKFWAEKAGLGFEL